MKKLILACLTMVSVLVVGSGASAADSDELFFQSVEGKWSGPGEIVAGKYKGTKFVCKLEGSTPGFVAGMKLDGSCNVGIFSQPMKASVVRSGGTYQGEFNDGSEGTGLDVVSGKVTGNRVVLGLNRKDLNGVMLAHVDEDDSMNVTISVKVDSELVPVIDMNLKRVDANGASRNIAKN